MNLVHQITGEFGRDAIQSLIQSTGRFPKLTTVTLKVLRLGSEEGRKFKIECVVGKKKFIIQITIKMLFVIKAEDFISLRMRPLHFQTFAITFKHYFR